MTTTATCQTCGWTETGEQAEVDRLAAKHARTWGHPTSTRTKPEEGR